MHLMGGWIRIIDAGDTYIAERVKSEGGASQPMTGAVVVSRRRVSPREKARDSVRRITLLFQFSCSRAQPSLRWLLIRAREIVLIGGRGNLKRSKEECFSFIFTFFLHPVNIRAHDIVYQVITVTSLLRLIHSCVTFDRCVDLCIL